MAPSLFFVDDAMIDRTVTIARRVYRGHWSQLVTTMKNADGSKLTGKLAIDRLHDFARKIDRGFWLGWLKPNGDLKPTRVPFLTKNGLPRVWVTRAARSKAIELGATPVEFGSNLWIGVFKVDHK